MRLNAGKTRWTARMGEREGERESWENDGREEKFCERRTVHRWLHKLHNINISDKHNLVGIEAHERQARESWTKCIVRSMHRVQFEPKTHTRTHTNKQTRLHEHTGHDVHTNEQVNFVAAHKMQNDKNACSFMLLPLARCCCFAFLFFMAFFRSFDAVVPFVFYFRFFVVVVVAVFHFSFVDSCTGSFAESNKNSFTHDRRPTNGSVRTRMP